MCFDWSGNDQKSFFGCQIGLQWGWRGVTFGYQCSSQEETQCGPTKCVQYLFFYATVRVLVKKKKGKKKTPFLCACVRRTNFVGILTSSYREEQPTQSLWWCSPLQIWLRTDVQRYHLLKQAFSVLYLLKRKGKKCAFLCFSFFFFAWNPFGYPT